MKNKLRIEQASSDRLVSDFPSNTEERTRVSKLSGRRESVAPKIVVYPPMDESSPTSAPRGVSLLRALGRRLSRRPADDDSFGSSSSSDSVACESPRSRDCDRSSCSVSDSGSDDSTEQRRGRRHRSTVSLRRVFQSLNLSSRSQSCSPTERSRHPKKNPKPKRILRPPVTYTYVRGLSGLPTQRVPRYTVCCEPSGLNR